MKSKKVGLLSGCLSASVWLAIGGGTGAVADEALNGAQLQISPPASATTGSPSVTDTAASAPNGSPVDVTSGNAPQAGGNSSVSSGGKPTVAPGPLQEARTILITRIQQAQSEGIGIANYMMAFNAIEDSVKAGQSAEQLRPRVESLARALHDQLEKGKILKTQRPIPGNASATFAPPPSAVAGGGPDLAKIKAALGNAGGGGPGGGNASAIIEKLKERFGGQLPAIPEAYKDKIPKGILDKLGQ